MDTNKHCYLCTLSGNSSSWHFTNTKGAIVYALEQGAQDKIAIKPETEELDFGGEFVHEIRNEREAMARFNKHMIKTRKMEWNKEDAIHKPTSGLDLHVDSTGNPLYVLK